MEHVQLSLKDFSHFERGFCNVIFTIQNVRSGSSTAYCPMETKIKLVMDYIARAEIDRLSCTFRCH